MKYSEIISLGYDCGIARNARKLDVRFKSYPFDWLVSIDSIKLFSCIMNDFDGFTNITSKKKIKNIEYYVNEYDMIFLHHSHFNYEQLKAEFDKKIKNFYDVLNSKNDILLIRLSHGEHEKEYCSSIEYNPHDEILEFEKFKIFMNNKFDKNINMELFMCCDECSKKTNHQSLFKKNGDDNIVIYNYIKSVI